VNNKYGVPDHDAKQFDLGLCTALLGSLAPGVGWTLHHLFSDPALLSKLRHDIEAIVIPNSYPNTAATVTVNIAKLFASVPLLESFVREVLRFESTGTSARFLLDDTVIGSGECSYLLKKGSFLMIPAAPALRDEALWGPTADRFDPARFLPERQLGQDRKVPASAWRVFGGGHNLCPGRHLALREMLSVMVIVALRCDIEPCDERAGDRWRVPEKVSHISAGVLMPVQDIRVRIQPREEMRHISWEFGWDHETEKGGS
jgi:cytochrome P450